MRRYALICMLAACGDAEVIAPSSLTVVDTYPGNGSAILAGESTLAVIYSEPVDAASLGDALLLEEVSAASTPVRAIAAPLERYDEPTGTALHRVEPLGAGEYRLTLRASTLRARSGARMATDVIRHFKAQ